MSVDTAVVVVTLLDTNAPQPTCGLNLKLKVALVLMERGGRNAAACATYSSATFHDDNVRACDSKYTFTVGG